MICDDERLLAIQGLSCGEKSTSEHALLLVSFCNGIHALAEVFLWKENKASQVYNSL